MRRRVTATAVSYTEAVGLRDAGGRAPRFQIDSIAGFGIRDLFISPPQAILPDATSYLNVPFAVVPGYRPLRLDLHLRRDARGPVPLVVYASGGAWLISMKHHGPWTFLPAEGYGVAVVEYRLSGEAYFPAALHDLKGAVRWLRANAASYDLDGSRIAAWGSSAGAYLLAMLAVTNGIPEFEGDVGGNLEQSSSVLSVIDHYGPSDLAALGDDTNAIPGVVEPLGTPTSIEARLLGYPPRRRPAEAERANPAHYASAATVPFLIMHGEADTRIGIAQSRRLYDALRDAGADVTFHSIPGANHVGPEFFADEANALAREFLDRTIRRVASSDDGGDVMRATSSEL